MAQIPDKTFSLAELYQFNGADANKPLYLGCGGLVFDMSSARNFYGPGAGYGVFAGRDASKGLATMQVQYTNADISSLTDEQRTTLNEWKNKYIAKYPVVGRIVDASEPNSGSQ